MKGEAQGLTKEWESKNDDGEGRFFDCDWDYNNQGSVVEGFPMSEVVCLVSRVARFEVVFLALHSIGPPTPIICQGTLL